MALRKEMTLDNGVTADYWKVFQCEVKTGIVRMGLFKDKTTAENPGNNLYHKAYNWSKENPFTTEAMDEANQNPLKIAYAKIKESNLTTQEKVDRGLAEEVGIEQNWWADSVDC